METDLDKMDIRSQELRGSDKLGTGAKNYRTFDSKENVGSAVVSERATGRIGEVNVVGSIFDVEDGKGLDIGKVKVQSSVNEYDEFSLNENRNSTSKSSRKTESHTEENVSGSFRIGNKLKRRIKAKAKGKLKEKTGNYMKGFKRGKPYKYNSDEDAIRVYNYMPHAHLIEKGHRIVARGKKGQGAGAELGFKAGMHIVESTEREFTEEFIKDTEQWVDDLLKEGLS